MLYPLQVPATDSEDQCITNAYAHSLSSAAPWMLREVGRRVRYARWLAVGYSHLQREPPSLFAASHLVYDGSGIFDTRRSIAYSDRFVYEHYLIIDNRRKIKHVPDSNGLAIGSRILVYAGVMP